MAMRKSQQNTVNNDADKDIAKAVADTVGTSFDAAPASVETSAVALQEATDAAGSVAEKASAASTDVAEQVKEASAGATQAAGNAAAEGASAARDAAEQGQAAASSAAETFADNIPLVHRRALQEVGAASESVVAGVAQMQREIATFMSDRIRQDMSVQRELIQCRSFDELRAVQARFFQTAVDQYSAEATKLMQMSQDMMQRTMTRNMQ